MEIPIVSKRSNEGTILEDIFAPGAIVIQYLPIIDLFSGTIHGYSIHFRGTGSIPMQQDLMALASEYGKQRELEILFRRQAFQSLKSLDAEYKKFPYLLPVHPDTFVNPEMLRELSLNEFKACGLEPDRIALCASEIKGPYMGYGSFDSLNNLFLCGMRIALEDFGTGTCNLAQLIDRPPQYIKIAHYLTHMLYQSSEKQEIIRSFVNIASHLQTRLIADGVQTKGDLKVLYRLGVRYAQGSYFTTTTLQPEELSEKTSQKLIRQGRKVQAGHPQYDRIHDIIETPPTFEVGSMTTKDLDFFFHHNPTIDHVIVLDEQNPYGLITQDHYAREASGQYGYFLIQKAFIEELVKKDQLVVEESTPLGALGRRAVERSQESLYDPIIIINREGHFVGTITMKRLLSRFIELEVQLASSANPLTGLPGNQLIQAWITEVLSKPQYTIVYADLDKFKEYNDCYGFTKGDQMIKLAADVLSHITPLFGPGANLGHVGGDDFILVIPDVIEESSLVEICKRFDQDKERLFTPEHFTQGFYSAKNRQGESENIPLCTISLAVITNENLGENTHPGQIGEVAASTKKSAKLRTHELGHSAYAYDRRTPANDDENETQSHRDADSSKEEKETERESGTR